MKIDIIQVQALRSVERYLQLDKLYVLGTNCVDNGPPEGLGKFLKAASSSPETVLHYEFMQVCSCTAAVPYRSPHGCFSQRPVLVSVANVSAWAVIFLCRHLCICTSFDRHNMQ